MSKTNLKTCAGINNKNGGKVCFGTDFVRRSKQMAYRGINEVNMVELPEPMGKIDALNFLLKHENFQGRLEQMIIKDAIEDRAKKYKRMEMKVVREASKKESMAESAEKEAQTG
jgi:hypothetical protein